MDVVGEVIEIEQPHALRSRILCAQPFELGIIGRALGAIAADEIEQAATDALDCGNVEHFLRRVDAGGFGAERDGAGVRLPGVDHAKRHRRRAGAVRGDEVVAVGAGRFIDEVVDVALAVDRDLLGAMAGDRHIAHQLEQRVQFFRIRVRVFDELKAIGTHRIVGANNCRRRVVRKWTHG